METHAHAYRKRATPPGRARAVADMRDPDGVLEGAQNGEPVPDDAFSNATALMLSRRAASVSFSLRRQLLYITSAPSSLDQPCMRT